MLCSRARLIAALSVLSLGAAAQYEVAPVVPTGHEVRVVIPELPNDATFATAASILRTAGLRPNNFLCDPASGSPGAVVGRVTAFVPPSGTSVRAGSAVDMRAIQADRCQAAIIRPDIFTRRVGDSGRNSRGRFGAVRGGREDVPPPPPPPPPSPPPATASAGPDEGPAGNGHSADGGGEGPQPGPPAAANGGSHPAPPGAGEEPPDPPAASGPDEPLTAPATDTGPDALPAGTEAGRGAFVEPSDMSVDTWHRVEFVVGRDDAALAEESEDQQLSRSREIFVAPVMRVTLLPDENFEIKPQSPAVQRTGLDKAASWQWSVRPLRGGAYHLVARVEVLESAYSAAAVETYTRRVPVQVRVGTWKGFLNALREAASLGDLLATLFRSWEKTLLALTALIAAAVGLWAAIKKLRAKE